MVRGGKERLRLPEFRPHAPSREVESGANNQDHATTMAHAVMTNLPVEAEAENPVLLARQDGAHEVPRARAAQGEACYAFIKHQLRIPNATGCAAARCHRNHITVGRSVSGAQRADLRAAFVDFPAGEALDTIRAAIAALPRS